MAKINQIALFKFEEGTGAEKIDQIFNDLLEVTENVDGVENFVSGANNSAAGMNQSFTHGAVTTFRDAAARDAFMTSTELEKFKAAVGPSIKDILVFDFEL